MMITKSLLLAVFVASASAAPALVWKRTDARNSRVLHSSDEISSASLLTDILREEPSSDKSLAAVVFLLARGERGDERLSQIAEVGALPQVEARQASANSIHHHVAGIQNGYTVVKEASKHGHNSLLVSLSEFHSKVSSLEEPTEVDITFNGSIMSKTEKATTKRAKDIEKANVLIVSVDIDTPASDIDSAVVKAIENPAVKNVVLTAVRSVDEVKHERVMESRRRLQIMHETGHRMVDSRHRRLEEAQAGDDNVNGANNNAADLSGIYYVSLTPNILAGLLFFFLFSTIIYIGVGCMGMIQGQDVFVTKMPVVGREA